MHSIRAACITEFHALDGNLGELPGCVPSGTGHVRVSGGCQCVLKDSPFTTSKVVSRVCAVACVASLATCSAVAVICAIDGVPSQVDT